MSQTFLNNQAARQVILNGLAVSVSISLLAIAAGSVLGVLAGLALTYGGRAARLALRTYIDIVRGTPVLVLVLASYYVSAAIGLTWGPSRPACWRWRCSARRTSARSCAARCRPFPGQTEAAKAIGLSFTQTFSSVLYRRRCANACRPGSTRRPRWSRRPPCCPSSAWPSCCCARRRSSRATS